MNYFFLLFTAIFLIVGGRGVASAAILADQPTLGDNLVGNGYKILNISTLTIGTNTLPPAGGVANITGDVHINGAVYASNIGGATPISAANVSAAAGGFGSLTGGGNYRFNDTSGNALLYTDAGNARVGIGTASPGALLYLSGVGTNGGFFALRSTTPATGSSGTGPNVFFRENSTERGWLGFLDYGVTGGAGTFNIQTYNGDIRFAAGSGTWDNYVMTIKNSGNVGIGTTNPLAHIDLYKLGGAVQYIRDDTSGFKITTANNGINYIESAGAGMSGAADLRFTDMNAANTWMVIKNSGNVGIGTVTPGAKLEIAGQVKITGGTPGAGKVLTSDASGLGTWTTLPPAGVSSVFGRTGAITAASGDYSVAQITGAAPLASPSFTGNITMPGTGIWTSAGSVGIGTTNPPSWSKLAVNGDIALTSQGSWPGYVGITSETAGVPMFIKARGGANPDLVVHTSGNVGIGTATPGAKLEVAGDVVVSGNITASNIGGATTINAGNVAAGVFGSLSTKGNYTFQASGNTNSVLFVDAGGEKVGIGTASPGDKLTVANGALNVTGDSCDDESNFKIKNGELVLQWSGGGNCGNPPSRMGLLLHNAELTNAVGLFPSGALDPANTTYAFQNAYANYPANRVKMRNGNFSFGYKAASTITSFTEADWQDRLFIEGGTGEVGIGTTNPSYKLDSGSNTTDELRMGRLRAGSWIGVDGSYMRIQNDALASTLGNQALRQGQSGDTQINSASGQNLDLSIANAPKLTVHSSGNVGIGTTNPPAWSKLGVNGDIAFTSQGSWPGYVSITSETAGVPMIIKARSGANPDLVVHTSGNVGIGNANPQHALDIQGAYYSRMVENGNQSGPTLNIDWNRGNIQHIILTGNITTVNFTGGQSGGRYVLIVKQGAAYSISWPTSIRFPGGATFNITTTAGKTDYMGFLYNGVDLKYDSVAFSAAF